MKDMLKSRFFRKVVHWSLLVILVLKIVSGYGITQFKVVTPLTFGLMGKALAFQVHSALAAPLIVLLILHIYLTL